MRNAFSLLALSATLTAQEPPVLTTNPPVQTAQFGATALGGGVTEVAQITFIRDQTANNWYVTATVKTPASTFYAGWSGRCTVAGSPPVYTLTANNDFANVPAPTTDYFAFNVSSDLLIMVVDTGAATPPAVYARTATNVPFTSFGSVPGVSGYVDSQLADTLTSWNGTTGSYEFFWIQGNNLVKATMTLTAPATVTLGAPVVTTTAGVAQHSQSALRQTTGLPSDWGTCRAMIHSRNNSSADAFYRSSCADNAIVNIPSLQIWDDANWKANPGNIGGSTIWAYAVANYQNPLQCDVVCMSSATVPAAGGTLTICAWAPPSGQPNQAGFVMLGIAAPGLPLPGITIGNLGLNPGALVFLPIQVFDAVLGEISYTFVTGTLPRGRIDMQVGAVNFGNGRIYLGNNAQINVL
jgi:hypothetical protein